MNQLSQYPTFTCKHRMNKRAFIKTNKSLYLPPTILCASISRARAQGPQNANATKVAASYSRDFQLPRRTIKLEITRRNSDG